MARDRSFCGASALVSTPVTQKGMPNFAGTLNKGIWSRLQLGGATASHTSVDKGGGNVLEIDTSIDSTDPDTTNGIADYPQYSVLKFKGDTGAAASGVNSCFLPNNMLRVSWPVTDIFGRKVTKMDTPYVHLFWLDLPLAQLAVSGMQDPWQADGNDLTAGFPHGDPDFQIGVCLSELPADEYVSLTATSDSTTNAWPFIGACLFANANNAGFSLKMLDCRGKNQGTYNYDDNSANARARTMYGNIITAPDALPSCHVVVLETVATDDPTLQYFTSGTKMLKDHDFQLLDTTNDIYWTLNIGRTLAAPAVDAVTVAFNLYVASIPMFPAGGNLNDSLWDLISPIDYVAGAGGADGA